MRTHGALAVAVALMAACGGQPKEAGTKSGVIPEAPAKEGPSAKAMSGGGYTVLMAGEQTKSVSEYSIGQTAQGSLSEGDDQMEPGQYVDLFVIDVSSPTDVDLTLESSDFDAYLLLFEGRPGAAGGLVGENDDGGDGTNSALAASLAPGSYVAVVTSFSTGTGAYTLSSSSMGADNAAGLQGRLQRGGAVSGQLTSSSPTLDDGSHYQLWNFDGQAGEEVTISLISDDFDAYMMLFQGAGLDGERLASDDDGAGGLNARITHTLPSSGTYTVVANSYGAGTTGAYRIELQGSLADWDARYPGGGDPNGKYAVVVGIDDYPGTSHDLRGPIDDATLVHDALVDKFGFSEDNIVFLQDGEATRLGIANAILRHLGQAGPNGTAVFFYSGHGTHLDENVGITGELDPESGNNQDEALAVYDGIILDEEFNFLLQQIQAENTLVLVDACFSGTVNRGADALAKFIPEDETDALSKPATFITADLTSDFGFGSGAEFRQALSNPDRFVFMAASSEDQVSWAIGSWPDRDGPASLWTYYWAQVVNEVPASTSFTEIHRMVSQRVNQHVEDAGNLGTQTPQLLAPQSKADMGIGAFLRAN
jgi:hypothetical protein